ncbi:hypothetical protein GOBAR_AA19772 [Gossypium barbadense]|uniref:SHSP domain-containing protein n=1 Tax=Gossypium barbadense TaxID=3634 RepID=A0A2P5XC09_GOSBA|nr:hypothetical protein GOBAR_AA19772 [Gossypium barbadense]
MSLIPSFFGNRRSNIFYPFVIDVWDPFKNLESLFRENSALVNTCIDWKETSGAHVFKADLPGLEKEEIEDERRSSGKFSRWFKLPENVKTDLIKASMENKVLIVTIPKMEVKKPDVKTIQVSG